MLQKKYEEFKKRESLILEDFAQLRRPGNYAKGVYLSKQETKDLMCKYQEKPIPRSLYKLSTEHCGSAKESDRVKSQAPTIFENILVYTGVKKKKTEKRIAAAVSVLKTGGREELLRDEIFLQLIKQTTECPKADVDFRGWRLLYMCARSFPTSSQLKPFLLSHAAKHASEYCPTEDDKPGFDNISDIATNMFLLLHHSKAYKWKMKHVKEPQVKAMEEQKAENTKILLPKVPWEMYRKWDQGEVKLAPDRRSLMPANQKPVIEEIPKIDPRISSLDEKLQQLKEPEVDPQISKIDEQLEQLDQEADKDQAAAPGVSASGPPPIPQQNNAEQAGRDRDSSGAAPPPLPVDGAGRPRDSSGAAPPPPVPGGEDEQRQSRDVSPAPPPAPPLPAETGTNPMLQQQEGKHESKSKLDGDVQAEALQNVAYDDDAQALPPPPPDEEDEDSDEAEMKGQTKDGMPQGLRESVTVGIVNSSAVPVHTRTGTTTSSRDFKSSSTLASAEEVDPNQYSTDENKKWGGISGVLLPPKIDEDEEEENKSTKKSKPLSKIQEATANAKKAQKIVDELESLIKWANTS